MLQVLILICAQNVSVADCQTKTALDIIHGPEVVSVMACGMQSQVLLADSSLLRQQGDYAKIRCLPRDRIVTAANRL